MIDAKQIKTEVLELCKETRNWKSQHTEYRGMPAEVFNSLMESKFNYLHTNSKTLFERCIQGDLNMQQLNYMLEMLEKVNAGNDYQAVSQEIGQKMVDIYVKPLLEKK